MESPSELINKAIGTTSKAIPSSVSRVAAKSWPSAEIGSDAQVQGVEGHREDQGPDREQEKGGQNTVTEQRHSKENSGADQRIKKTAREPLFEVRVGCGERCHGEVTRNLSEVPPYGPRLRPQ